MSYYVVQQIIKNEKHLFKIAESKDDDCRCEKCENVGLLLSGIKQSLKKNGHSGLALTLKTDPEKLILENVCSIKNYDCGNDDCGKCCNFRNVEDILIVLEGVSEAKYARWVCREKHYQKDEVADSGDDVIVMLKQIRTKSFKMHVYNISCQYSELKHFKANLKEDEIILSVDFSKNYDNKQHHEIQSACSGHEAFTLYTAACYHRSHDTDGACVDKDAGLKVLSFAIVSKEIIHEQNLVFSCDMKLLEIVRQQ